MVSFVQKLQRLSPNDQKLTTALLCLNRQVKFPKELRFLCAAFIALGNHDVCVRQNGMTSMSPQCLKLNIDVFFSE